MGSQCKAFGQNNAYGGKLQGLSGQGTQSGEEAINFFDTGLALTNCIIAGEERKFHFVWPTVAEVQNSLEGWAAGGSIPGSAQNVKKPFLQQCWRRQAFCPDMPTCLATSGPIVQNGFAASCCMQDTSCPSLPCSTSRADEEDPQSRTPGDLFEGLGIARASSKSTRLCAVVM